MKITVLEYYVYILSNNRNTVFYIGITNNLQRRVFEHKNHSVKGFTLKYNVTKLVYFEVYPLVEEAIFREKQLKGGSRKKKINLIVKKNPEYKDLYDEIL